MDQRSRGNEKIERLIAKGVSIPAPDTVHIADDVDVDRVSGDGVVIWPGCRIRGSRTVISAGCQLGAEGPVTLVDCRLGPSVKLKGGYFTTSVFLAGANMGTGAQVREGCLLEEEANGAHTVGLKQTILLPFATLGSLINFCDCLLAGGTSRKDHSEVGSSYIHFNYTPDGDKTTPSMFGDVARGVMLDQPPIFLGGQGGAVGPVRVEYGTVVAAGSIVRHDVLEPGHLVSAPPAPEFEVPRRPHTYARAKRIVKNNVIYMANLAALALWYHQVREPFFRAQELGGEVLEGALEMLAIAQTERSKRLIAMAGKVSAESNGDAQVFRDRAVEVCAVFDGPQLPDAPQSLLDEMTGEDDYLESIRSLSPQAREAGVAWLQSAVDKLLVRVDAIVPELDVSGD